MDCEPAFLSNFALTRAGFPDTLKKISDAFKPIP